MLVLVLLVVAGCGSSPTATPVPAATQAPAATAAPSTADNGDLLAQIKKRGFIRVGTFSIPPETWIDTPTGEWMGVDADFSKDIAKSIGVEADPVVLVHASMAPSLDAGRVDVIAGLYKTAEREQVMSYNTVPFWYAADVVVAGPSGGEIKSLADLKGKVIGVVRASAQEVEANEIVKRDGAKEIRKFDAAEPMLMDLRAGRVDAAIWWGYTYDYARQQNPAYDLRLVGYIPPEYFGRDTLNATYYVFKKSSTSDSLIKAFDDFLGPAMKDGRAEAILKKYGLSDSSYWTGKVTK